MFKRSSKLMESQLHKITDRTSRVSSRLDRGLWVLRTAWSSTKAAVPALLLYEPSEGGGRPAWGGIKNDRNKRLDYHNDIRNFLEAIHKFRFPIDQPGFVHASCHDLGHIFSQVSIYQWYIVDFSTHVSSIAWIDPFYNPLCISIWINYVYRDYIRELFICFIYIQMTLDVYLYMYMHIYIY